MLCICAQYKMQIVGTPGCVFIEFVRGGVLKQVRKFALVVYILAGVCVVAAFAGSLFGPYTSRFTELIGTPVGQAFIAACLIILSLQMLAVLIALLFDKPDPSCMRLDGNPDIEVSIDALISVAKTAAQNPDIMIENVDARVIGRDKATVRVRVEAIPLVEYGYEGLARQLQQRIQNELDHTLGVSGANVQVRFLPSKTITVTREVAGE